MKKIVQLIVALIILLALILPLLACGPEIEKEEPAGASMFVVVEEAYDWTVVYHRQTKVMYVYSTPRYGNGEARCNSSFTVMLDAYGKPLLWRGE